MPGDRRQLGLAGWQGGSRRHPEPWTWLVSSHPLNPFPAPANAGTSHVAPVWRRPGDRRQRTSLGFVKGGQELPPCKQTRSRQLGMGTGSTAPGHGVQRPLAGWACWGARVWAVTQSLPAPSQPPNAALPLLLLAQMKPCPLFIILSLAQRVTTLSIVSPFSAEQSRCPRHPHHAQLKLCRKSKQ